MVGSGSDEESAPLFRVMSDPFLAECLRIEVVVSNKYSRYLRIAHNAFPLDRWFHVTIRVGYGWRGEVPWYGLSSGTKAPEGEPEVSVYIDSHLVPYTVLKQNRIVRAGAGWEEARPNLTSVRGIFFWNEDGSHHYQPSAAFGTDLAFAAGAITENITTFELWDVDPTSDLNITISIMSGFSSLVDNIVPQQVSVYVNGAEKISGLFAGQTKSVYILNSDLVDALQDHDAGTIRLSLRSDANNLTADGDGGATAVPDESNLRYTVRLSSGIVVSLRGTLQINDIADEHLSRIDISTHAISSSHPGPHMATTNRSEIRLQRNAALLGQNDPELVNDGSWLSMNGPRFSMTAAAEDAEFVSSAEDSHTVEAFFNETMNDISVCMWIRPDALDQGTTSVSSTSLVSFQAEQASRDGLKCTTDENSVVACDKTSTVRGPPSTLVLGSFGSGNDVSAWNVFSGTWSCPQGADEVRETGGRLLFCKSKSNHGCKAKGSVGKDLGMEELPRVLDLATCRRKVAQLSGQYNAFEFQKSVSEERVVPKEKKYSWECFGIQCESSNEELVWWSVTSFETSNCDGRGNSWSGDCSKVLSEVEEQIFIGDVLRDKLQIAGHDSQGNASSHDVPLFVCYALKLGEFKEATVELIDDDGKQAQAYAGRVYNRTGDKVYVRHNSSERCQPCARDSQCPFPKTCRVGKVYPWEIEAHKLPVPGTFDWNWDCAWKDEIVRYNSKFCTDVDWGKHTKAKSIERGGWFFDCLKISSGTRSRLKVTSTDVSTRIDDIVMSSEELGDDNWGSRIVSKCNAISGVSGTDCDNSEENRKWTTAYVSDSAANVLMTSSASDDSHPVITDPVADSLVASAGDVQTYESGTNINLKLFRGEWQHVCMSTAATASTKDDAVTTISLNGIQETFKKIFHPSAGYRMLIGASLPESWVLLGEDCDGFWRYKDEDGAVLHGGWSIGNAGAQLCPTVVNGRCECKAFDFGKTGNFSPMPAATFRGRISRVSVWSRRLSKLEMRADGAASSYGTAVFLNSHELKFRWDELFSQTGLPLVPSTRIRMTIPLMREYGVTEGMSCGVAEGTLLQECALFDEESQEQVDTDHPLFASSEACMSVGRAMCDGRNVPDNPCLGFTSRWIPQIPKSPYVMSSGFSYAGNSSDVPTVRITEVSVSLAQVSPVRLQVNVIYDVADSAFFAHKFGVHVACAHLADAGPSSGNTRFLDRFINHFNRSEAALTSVYVFENWRPKENYVIRCSIQELISYEDPGIVGFRASTGARTDSANHPFRAFWNAEVTGIVARAQVAICTDQAKVILPRRVNGLVALPQAKASLNPGTLRQEAKQAGAWVMKNSPISKKTVSRDSAS